MSDKDVDLVKHQMEKMDADQLRSIMQYANSINDRRNQQRKKELWGNVKAAIAKYESEIGQISFYCRCCGEDCTIDKIENDNPGAISIS